MLDKWDYRVYDGVKRANIYYGVCDYWARMGFYVFQNSAYEISGQSYQPKIGLRREFYLRMNEYGNSTQIDLNFRAKITDEGLMGGAAATLLFAPAAVIGGALSYSEYERDANNLMNSFWAYMDQMTNVRGRYATSSPQPQTQLQPQPSPNYTPCTKCGALLPENWQSCPYCGKPKE